jgi:PAS domain S-box-containing protein
MNRPLRVLHVEDSERDAALLMRHLSRAGYELISERVDTPKAMRTALETKDCDVILCDYSMPHFNALSALALLREMAVDLPFIIISGTVGEAVAVEAMRSGAHDYLMKDNLVRLAPAIERELHEAENRRARRQAEDQLRGSRLYTRLLMESNIDALMTTDPSGVITDVNQQMESLSGRTREELIGTPFKQHFTHPERAEDGIRSVLRDGRVANYELTARSKDGDETVVSYNATTFNDQSGNLQGVFGAARDVTERKRFEHELQETNLQLQKANEAGEAREEALQATGLKLTALVELGMELGSEHDAKQLLSRFCLTARRIIGARKSMLGILSEESDELKHFLINGRKDAKPIVDDRPPVHHPVLETIVNDRSVVRINHAEADPCLGKLTLDNSPVQSFLGVPLMSANEVYGWLVLLEKEDDDDFSEEDEQMAATLAAQAAIAYENAVLSERLQRNAEELDMTRREQLEMKDQFISHVSHELRSPLSAIHQFTTILLDGLAGGITEEQREYLDIVLRNSLQLRDMIGDLLEVTRAQSGKLTIKPQPTLLCDLFDPVIKTYERRAIEKALTLRIRCPPDLPPVQADPNRIGQVFSNLLDNALKFTTHGAISVSGRRDEDAGFVRIAVSDSGCGISADSLPKIFDRLYQSPNNFESSRKGLGLGLHICQHLIELHGGRIWVESKEGEGATVFFTVPVATVEQRNSSEFQTLACAGDQQPKVEL